MNAEQPNNFHTSLVQDLIGFARHCSEVTRIAAGI
jgi:hypothetical protein